MGGHAFDSRIAVLDAARALAILGVIAVHLGLWMPNLPAGLGAFAAMGQYGVQLFFVISAITVSHTLEVDERRYGACVHTVVPRFYFKRFVRIAPLYYAAIAIYALLDHAARLAHGAITLPHDFTDVAANLLFLHGWLPGAINSVVPGGWSIGVEMSFYALAPFILYACRTARGRWLTSATLLGGGAALGLAGACFFNPACRVVNNQFTYFWLPVQMPCFVFGLWLAQRGMSILDGSRRLGASTLTALAAAAVASLALLYEVGAGGQLAHGVAPAVAALASVCLLILAAHLPARWLRTPVLAAFGQQSYGVYLWSSAIVALFRALLKTPVGLAVRQYPASGFLVALLLVCGLSYVAALAATRWIDRPCGDLIRRALFERRRKTPRRVASTAAGREAAD